MKKLLNVLLVAILLLVGMTPVFAASGKITIANAEAGKTYKIYEILHLESYNEEKNAFAYKATTKWKSFVESETGKKYFNTNEQGYVTWVENADAARLAVDAINYAKANKIAEEDSKTAQTTGKLEFAVADLGYYLVDSTLGALCNLTTTKPTATINEKNTPPTIKKEVKEDSNNQYGEENTAQIGDVIDFKTTIYAKKGAENYKLIDNMTAGLTLDPTSIVVTAGNKTLVSGTDYDLTTETNGFTITFKKSYLDTITKNTEIVVTYKATLNENAIVGNITDKTYGKGNDNQTVLKYGDNHETEYDQTRTYTFSFDLVKTDKDKIQLEGAEFILLDKRKNVIPVVKVEGKDNTYRVALPNETGVNIVAGHVTIEGLDEDTYYLKEVKQPDGYNKLATDVTVVMTKTNNSATTETTTETVDGKTITTIKYVSGGVQVINYNGTELPSTGGFGTFMFVLMGTLTVLACGILLVTKFRMAKLSA